MYHNATDMPARSSKLLPLCIERSRLKIYLLFNSKTIRIHLSVQLGHYLLSYLHCKEFVYQLCSLFQNQLVQEPVGSFTTNLLFNIKS